MNDELIEVTSYGTHLGRAWEETHILGVMGGIMSVRTCSCPCTNSCPEGSNTVEVCFPGY